MISIIIPSYNEEKYIARLLKSIKSQPFKDYEIILADANSTDKTRDIAKREGCIVVKGGAPAQGRNNGARKAKGDILLFADADSLLPKDYLSKAISEFKRRKLDAAGSFIKPIGNNLLDMSFFAIFNFWTCLTQSFYPNASGCGIICKKALHRKIKGFDGKIRLSEDMDYVRRAGKKGRFRMLNDTKILVSMRRFEKEGRFKVGIKLLLSAFYRVFFGEIKSDVFRYDLRHRK